MLYVSAPELQTRNLHHSVTHTGTPLPDCLVGMRIVSESCTVCPFKPFFFEAVVTVNLTSLPVLL